MHPSWTFHKATRNANSSWLVFPHLLLDPISCRLVSSAVWCWLPTAFLPRPSPTAFSGFLLPTLRLTFPCLLLVASEISSPNPLSGFVPKQTKGSSAWRTTYIVSQAQNELNTFFILKLNICILHIHYYNSSLTSIIIILFLKIKKNKKIIRSEVKCIKDLFMEVTIQIPFIQIWEINTLNMDEKDLL